MWPEDSRVHHGIGSKDILEGLLIYPQHFQKVLEVGCRISVIRFLHRVIIDWIGLNIAWQSLWRTGSAHEGRQASNNDMQPDWRNGLHRSPAKGNSFQRSAAQPPKTGKMSAGVLWMTPRISLGIPARKAFSKSGIVPSPKCLLIGRSHLMPG